MEKKVAAAVKSGSGEGGKKRQGKLVLANIYKVLRGSGWKKAATAEGEKSGRGSSYWRPLIRYCEEAAGKKRQGKLVVANTYKVLRESRRKKSGGGRREKKWLRQLEKKAAAAKE
ncbi:MAG: hypothetical protein M3R17_15165 [Bacteroidota bacterium]|nr:hypothetical protein [Bacteroidota bacterium]